MDERQRLVERIFSREGAQEDPRDYVDTATGVTVRMTPSEWALAEYDRTHASAEPSPAARGSAQNPASADVAGDFDSDEPDVLVAGGDERPGEAAVRDADPPSTRRRLVLAGVVAGAFVLGVVVTLGVSAATGLFGTSGPGTSPVGAATTMPQVDPDGQSTSTPNGDWHPYIEPEIQEYFDSTPRVDDLPSAVTDGFDPTSFRLVAGSAIMRQSASIYAAERIDGQYCLVAVADQARVVETCATAAGISQHGLSLTKDAVSDVDGHSVTVTVTWGQDGTISWEALPDDG